MSAGYSEGSFKVDLAALETAGGVAAIANPEGQPVLVTNLIVVLTTKATGACTLDAGIAANGTTSSDNLIDGMDAGTAAGNFNNVTNAGSNGKAVQPWAAGEYLTISKKTGDAAGLEGYARVKYIRI